MAATMTDRFAATKAMQEIPGAHAEFVRVYEETGDATQAISAVLAFARTNG